MSCCWSWRTTDRPFFLNCGLYSSFSLPAPTIRGEFSNCQTIFLHHWKFINLFFFQKLNEISVCLWTVRFRFSNPYRNRNGNLLLKMSSSWIMIQNGAPCRFAKNQVYLFKVLVLCYTKICYAEWFYYTVEKICHFSLNIDWKFITISENSETYLSYCFGIEFRFRFGKKSIFRFRSGFGEIPFRSFTYTYSRK